MVDYWVNIHGEWISLKKEGGAIMRAVPGEASEGSLDIGDGYFMVSVRDSVYYVHESCVQTERVR